MGLACLTEAVNKGCCWLDQTASTFWRKRGIGAAWLGWLGSKGWLPGIEHVDQQYLSGSGLLERDVARWHAFWWLSAEDVMLLGNKVSDLPTPCLCSQKNGLGCQIFLSLTRFIINTINICISKYVYYENVFYNSSSDTYYTS
jgi:hypothetical protein